MKSLAIFFYVLSAIFCGEGFYKLLSYRIDSYAFDNVNAYVFATFYFTFAGILLVLASSILIINIIKSNNEQLHSDILETRRLMENKSHSNDE